MCSGKSIQPPDDGEPVLLDEIHNLKDEELWYEYAPMIGCTTEGAPVSDPLKSRMVELWMEEYTLQELTTIVVNATGLSPMIGFIVALRGRGSPRVSIQIGNQVQMALRYNSIETPTSKIVGDLCQNMGYLNNGFTINDLSYLEVLSKGYASASTLASTLNLPVDTIKTEIEPLLMRKGLVRITSRGRELCGNLGPVLI